MKLALCVDFPSTPEPSSNTEWRVKSLNLSAVKLGSIEKPSSTLPATTDSTKVLGECVLVACLQLHDGRRHSTQQVHVWNVRFHGMMGRAWVERFCAIALLSLHAAGLTLASPETLGVPFVPTAPSTAERTCKGPCSSVCDSFQVGICDFCCAQYLCAQYPDLSI